MNKIKNWVSDNPKKFKRLVLLVVLAFVILLSGISASASTLSDKLEDPTQFIEDRNQNDLKSYPYYIIYQQDNGEFVYYFSKKPFTFTELNSPDYIGTLKCKSLGIRVKYKNGDFTAYDYVNSPNYLVNYTYMCYSNHNIKYAENSERVFFYASPLIKKGFPIIGGQISTQTVVNLMTREILTILPFLIVLVVSLLALRKALATLFRLLHKA